MKNVVLSADGERKVYSVPDAVAEDLPGYCCEFCLRWLRTSPHAEKYRTEEGFCYDESSFIEYLNEWVFPEEPSVLVENLGWLDFNEPLPAPYTDCPDFNF